MRTIASFMWGFALASAMMNALFADKVDILTPLYLIATAMFMQVSQNK